MELDKFDLKILQSLQTNARQPTARLAEDVGLSASPTWERIRKLEGAGVLRGYHADVAVEHITQLVHILVPVSLASHRAEDFRRFEQEVLGIPEVVECWAVGGEVDYLLRFIVPNIGNYQELIERALGADVGIERYWT